MDATVFAPYPVRISPTARAEKEAAALLGRPGVWPVMLTTFLLCAVALTVPLIAADTVLTLLQLAALTPFVFRMCEFAIYSLAAVAAVLAVWPLWLGRLRLAGALFGTDDLHSGEVFYYMTSPRRWGRALGIFALFAALYAVPVGLSVGLFLLCGRLYETVLLALFTDFFAKFFYVLMCLGAAVLTLGLLLLCGVWLPFLAVAVGNEEMRLFAVLAVSVRAGGRNLATCAAFLLKSLLRLLLGLLTVGVLQALWNTHLFLLAYTRLSMALCPKGEPQ